MKKIIPLFLLLAFSNVSFCQQTNPAPTLTKQDYLKNSKNQKTTAWIMAGGGASLIIIAAATTTVEDYGNYIFGGDESGFNNGATLFTIGGLSMLGSIPFFIASGKNNRRAMSVSFKNETVPQIQKNSIAYENVPSIALKISL
jgi:hypothetical protein